MTAKYILNAGVDSAGEIQSQSKLASFVVGDGLDELFVHLRMEMENHTPNR
ncbi:MAG: hypothetical protein ACI9QL_003820 [Candidatus Omnitrophota bacterium]|jgi:hypothetical protein